MLTSEQLEVIRQNSRDEAGFQRILASLSQKPSALPNQAAETEQIEMLETVFRFVPVGITVHEPDGTLLTFNESARQILHISPDRPEELDPRLSTWHTFHPDGSLVAFDEYPAAQALMTGQPSGGQLFQLQLLDGESIWVEAHAAPLILAGESEPYGVVASIIDVTRWREAEAAAYEQGTLLRQLAEHIQEVFYVRDAQSNALQYISSAYEKVWGQPVADLLQDANSFVQYIHPDDLQTFHSEFRSKREDGRPLEVKYRILRETGEIRWIRDRAFPIYDEQGQLARWAGVAEDITDQMEYEQFLQSMNKELETRVAERTLELEKANEHLSALAKVKDEFVSNISHELKTPLTNIFLYLKLLKKRPEREARYIEILDREAERLKLIVENLLNISRLNYEQINIDLRLVVIDKLIEQFVEDRRELAIAKQINLRFYRKTQNSQTTLLDELWFMQALGYLFTNAVNYTPTNGSITVVVEPEQREDAAGVCVCISDTGHGFSAEERPHLFDRFFRGTAAELTQLPGTGLGLAIAREIVRHHGGQITAISDGMEMGATFKIWVPIRTHINQA